MNMTIKTINALALAVTGARKDLRDLEIELREASIAAAPVAVGGVVRDPGGMEYKVCRIETSFNEVCLIGNPRKKNGEWSKNDRHVYGTWTVVEAGK